MHLREENMKNCLDGVCTACNKKVEIKFHEEWHLDRCYKVGNCTLCGYEHFILVKNITTKARWVREKYPN
jgi:hypothetical protein